MTDEYDTAAKLAVRISRLELQEVMTNTDVWELSQLRKLWAEKYGILEYKKGKRN